MAEELNTPEDQMIISAISLAMKMIYEGIDFFPILYYFDEDEVVSSTIDLKLRFEDLETIIHRLASENGFFDYVFIFNVHEENRFYIRINMGGKTYAYRMIDYSFVDERVVFSEMRAIEAD